MTAETPELLGWEAEGPTLRLDYRRFSYAGKFVMSSTGKAVIRGDPPTDTLDRDLPPELPDADEYDQDVLAAVAFNTDRTDPGTLWLRYVTVRKDHRGEGLAPELVGFVVEQASEHGYERVRIAVNNPYSYEALYAAGFGFTGDRTGLAELVLEHPAPGYATDRADSYRAGLDAFVTGDDHDLTEQERAFVAEKRERGPPGFPG
ncbi:GNAT family N-acetyltransferase [Haloarchaeobius sp. DFWS5]|uniref:GNAT family N-acetyltransferase n=1 Tax=Haloarchaeobius sp. DFWS5 TaxID=3446114 RepID=UPI003EB9929A